MIAELSIDIDIWHHELQSKLSRVNFSDMKLHLGAGWRFLPGWKHLDITFYPHVDYLGSVADLSRFSADSIEEIYASHLLEYFSHEEALQVLKEWQRVLVPGGRVWVAVPNFESLIEIYQRTKDLKAIMGPLFGQMDSDVGKIFHRCVFDAKSLTEILIGGGFKDVAEYDPVTFLASMDESYDDHSLAFFPHFDRNGVQVSLCLTATK